MTLRWVRDGLIVLCLGLLAFSLGVVAWHMPRWTRAADKTMVHVDEFAGEGKIAMKNLAASSIESKKSAKVLSDELPGIISKAQGTLGKLNTVLDATTGTVQEAQLTLRTASGTLQSATDTFGTANQQIVRIGDSTTAALDKLPPVLESSRQMLDSANVFLNGPLTKTAGNVDKVLIPTGLLISDVQVKTHGWLYPEPYKGKYPFLHKTWGLTRGLLPLAQPSYYAVKIGKGE